jgi:hypothetical protein
MSSLVIIKYIGQGGQGDIICYLEAGTRGNSLYTLRKPCIKTPELHLNMRSDRKVKDLRGLR